MREQLEERGLKIYRLQNIELHNMPAVTLGLPDRDRMIVELKYFEDMKLEDIAAVMDENINTVKSRLYRSLQKLKNCLKDDRIFS